MKKKNLVIMLGIVVIVAVLISSTKISLSNGSLKHKVFGKGIVDKYITKEYSDWKATKENNSLSGRREEVTKVNCDGKEDVQYFKYNDALYQYIGTLNSDENIEKEIGVAEIYENYVNNDKDVDISAEFKVYSLKNVSSDYYFAVKDQHKDMYHLYEIELGHSEELGLKSKSPSTLREYLHDIGLLEEMIDEESYIAVYRTKIVWWQYKTEQFIFNTDDCKEIIDMLVGDEERDYICRTYVEDSGFNIECYHPVLEQYISICCDEDGKIGVRDYCITRVFESDIENIYDAVDYVMTNLEGYKTYEY